MILKNITLEHVFKELERIDQKGINNNIQNLIITKI